MSDAAEPPKRTLSTEILTRYISYARKRVQPALTDDACMDLQEAYQDLRRLGNSRRTISATPRQLESLIRLSEAHARMRFSFQVERIDVAEAVRLLRVALHQAAMDPDTGRIDMEKLITGHSAADRANIEVLATELRNMLAPRRGASVKFWKLLQDLNANRDKVSFSSLEHLAVSYPAL